jgi:predicted phage terminase large subunit-like protein
MKSGAILIPHIELRRRSIDDQVAAILTNHDKYNFKDFAIETNNFQVAIKQLLEDKSKMTGRYIPITPIGNYTDKYLRIQSIVPLLSDGTIIFDSSKAENDFEYASAIIQLCTYSKQASKDDFPDSLEMLVKLCRKSRFRMLTRNTKGR